MISLQQLSRTYKPYDNHILMSENGISFILCFVYVNINKHKKVDFSLWSACKPKKNVPPRERVEMLARPNSRRLRSLWDEKCAILPKERRDKIKSALEEDYFLSPE